MLPSLDFEDRLAAVRQNLRLRSAQPSITIGGTAYPATRAQEMSGDFGPLPGSTSTGYVYGNPTAPAASVAPTLRSQSSIAIGGTDYPAGGAFSPPPVAPPPSAPSSPVQPTAAAAAARAQPVTNPAAYNYGRLSMPRTDVAPVTPPASVPVTAPATMLPTGNISARNAMLRVNFPNASAREVSALGAYAFNRPAQFNTSMAGTGLDPAMSGLRQASAQANLDSTRTSTAATAQGMQISAQAAPANLDATRASTAATVQGTQIHADEAARRISGDAFAGQAAGTGTTNVPSGVLFQAAEQALQREQHALRRSAGFGSAAEAASAIPAGRPGQISQTADGRYITQFQTADKAKPESELGKLMAERDAAKTPEDKANYERAIANVHAGQQERPLNLNEFMNSPGLSGKFNDDYGAYRESYSVQIAKVKQPGAAAAKPAAGSAYKSAEEVRSAVLAGKLAREEALGILQKQFGMK